MLSSGVGLQAVSIAATILLALAATMFAVKSDGNVLSVVAAGVVWLAVAGSVVLSFRKPKP